MPEPEESTVKFVGPDIESNATGWGPVGVLEQFQGLPYQSFNKSDRIGKIADWAQQNDRFPQRGYRYQQHTAGALAGGANQYAYIHDGDESTFQLVDTSRAPRTIMQRTNKMRLAQQQKKMMQRERDRKAQAGYAIAYRGRGGVIGRGGPGAGGGPMGRGGAMGAGGTGPAWGNMRGGRGGFGAGRPPGRYDAQRNKTRQPSQTVQKEWIVTDDIDFNVLRKFRLTNVPNEDLPGESYGTTAFYNHKFDHLSTRKETPLVPQKGVVYNKDGTLEDPVMEKLIKDGAGNVFGTDVIMAALMCCCRSVYSWDVRVRRVGKLLIFDKRVSKHEKGDINSVVARLYAFALYGPEHELKVKAVGKVIVVWDLSPFGEGNLQLHLYSVTVSETAKEPPTDENVQINQPGSLEREAYLINQRFRLQVLRHDDTYKMQHPTAPWEDKCKEDDNDSMSYKAYKYRRYNMGKLPTGEEIQMVLRCEYDGALKRSDADDVDFIHIRAFNEWDSRAAGSGVDWRDKLESQAGAVLASEYEHNTFKICKWTVQAMLAQAAMLKFGYVSRLTPKTVKHAILQTAQYKPIEFAANISLDMANAWGILKEIIRICMEKPAGEYLIMKDPEKPAIRLYQLPANTFSSGESDDDDDEDEEDGDDEDDGNQAIGEEE